MTHVLTFTFFEREPLMLLILTYRRSLLLHASWALRTASALGLAVRVRQSCALHSPTRTEPILRAWQTDNTWSSWAIQSPITVLRTPNGLLWVLLRRTGSCPYRRQPVDFACSVERFSSDDELRIRIKRGQ